MNSLKPNDEGFTGLEAAIVLIAFVVVAAVFSYVVLGAGFFTTQKSQETVHTAVGQASSALEVSGNVIAKASSTSALGTVAIYLQLSAGGTGVDMTKVTYTVSTTDFLKTYTDSDTQITRDRVQGDDSDLLNSLQMDKITIDVRDATIGKNERFTIEVKPDKGAALPVSRVAPAALIRNQVYEVY
ncbi:archaellin/type IV pilin N-terminal domain-containing protein [Methanoregula sp.]|uniref:archaellin/type IV pilin N-terminal domain-containing protein n=1 Tax=Methanoregula sp. TaxID=2052170 RepID=UPI002375B7D1|nr:archaellin/type IV pilin N-terminal domain-containing protein [Methanoregula sp.]MDD1687070.1 flagellin [Methanoregula sp.]